ncbi:chitin disaccharide deacetylase [Clostridium sp. YIM B02551]|uniref:chitin disaccharide deacetylase n=1 Tax=Clostridium sp. YIM B02551 TaxID=2910679 RepID=UPI001EE9DDAF|nr:chitin disaccharide deacetylase [Clostridium sp. YIM B02551]
MRLIVNADDFGISKAVSLGIIEGHKNGIITSTTMMCNMPCAEWAAKLAKDYPDLGIGIHLVLTAGYPLSKGVDSLVDEYGKFKKISKIEENLKIEDVRKEFKCQMEKFISFGINPTHIDAHHHIHSIEKVFEVVKELAIEYKLPLRLLEDKDKKMPSEIKHTDRFIGYFYDLPYIKPEGFIDIMEKNKNIEILELMCHPGYLDEYILRNSAYAIQRAKELDTLTSDSVKQYISSNDIELCNYRIFN